MRIQKQQVPVAAQISPQLVANAQTKYSGWVDVSGYEAVMAVAIGGALDSGAAALAFQQTKADAAGDPSDGDKKAVSTFTGGSVTADDTALQVDNLTEKLDINGGFKFVRASLLTSGVGGTGAMLGLALFGVGPTSAS